MCVAGDKTLAESTPTSIKEYDITISEVSARLKHFGYTTTDADIPQLQFELQKIINYVLNYCNITTIPTVLNPRIIDRVCFEFLFYKKNSGQLEGFDYDAVIKEVKEGDTTLKYATGADGDTAESRFDKFVSKLERGFDKWITPHRRLRW